MHNNNFAVTSDQFNLGSHFLVWSIYYLSGCKHYYQKGNQITLPDNPMDKGAMAHEMKIKCPTSIEECREDIDVMSTTKNSYHLRFIPAARTLKGYVETNQEFTKLTTYKKIKVINIRCRDLQHLVAFLRSHILPNGSTLKTHPNWQNDIDIVKEHCTHYWPNFFANRDMFSDNLNGWDGIREQIAFNIRPYDYLNSRIDEKNEYVLHCDFEEIVVSPLNAYKKIFKFLDYQFNDERVKSWMPNHENWAKNIIPTIRFCNDLHKIIDSILRGKEMDLKMYGMDVLKEAIILHLLMYKHDLNFKINIDKLPDSTLEISRLLHKNVRTGIANLYGKEVDGFGKII